MRRKLNLKFTQSRGATPIGKYAAGILFIICGTGASWAQAVGSSRTQEEVLPPSWSESESVSGYFFGEGNAWDRSYRDFQEWKKRNNLPVSFGQQNWFHVNTGGPAATGYGVPGLRGTYYSYVTLSPSWEVTRSDIFDEVGFHVQTRFREADDRFRAFFRSNVWTYEAYAFASTGIGTFKGGQIWRRFGLDWDNTWWGNPQYFDGFKLNPDVGVSWEHKLETMEDFEMDVFAQYFAVQDRVSGALVGGSAETILGLEQRHTGVLSAVPTWQLGDASSLALGLSAQYIGEIEGADEFNLDSNQTAVALDLTYKLGNWSIFGEVTQSWGAVVPARYTSGGPSDRTTSVLGGIQYQHGPVLWRVNASAGWDKNPDGSQVIINPGATVQLTENVLFYAEYVYWEVENNRGVDSVFEDGVQLVFAWNF